MNKKRAGTRLRALLFAIMCVMFVVYGINRFLVLNHSDQTSPVIRFDQDLLEVSVDVTEEELLSGVTAEDRKDGDVTDTVIIESISKLLDGKERIVTYAAFDGDNHVGKAERRIRYTNYTPPRFYLDGPIRAASMDAGISEILKPLRAEDCIDGDLTEQIVVLDSELQSMTAEGLSVVYEVQVTNSCGDVASLKLPMTVSFDGGTGTKGYAELKLTDYLVYRKTGETLDYLSFVKSAAINGVPVSGVGIETPEGSGEEALAAENVLTVESDLDLTRAGVYTVRYRLKNEDAEASADLIIVVEE